MKAGQADCTITILMRTSKQHLHHVADATFEALHNSPALHAVLNPEK